MFEPLHHKKAEMRARDIVQPLLDLVHLVCYSGLDIPLPLPRNYYFSLLILVKPALFYNRFRSDCYLLKCDVNIPGLSLRKEINPQGFHLCLYHLKFVTQMHGPSDNWGIHFLMRHLIFLPLLHQFLTGKKCSPSFAALSYGWTETCAIL